MLLEACNEVLERSSGDSWQANRYFDGRSGCWSLESEKRAGRSFQIVPVYNFGCLKECGWEGEAYLSTITSSNPTCGRCGAETERIWRLGVRHIAASGFPFTTRNLSPDGSPETFNSQSELDRACRERGMTQRDDAAWITQEYLGIDMRTGQQRYKEGNGVGLPGCWI